MPKEYEYLFQDFDKLKIISKLKELKEHIYLEFNN